MLQKLRYPQVQYIHKHEKACKDSANKLIPLKPKLKKRIPCETANICQKRDILHKQHN